MPPNKPPKQPSRQETPAQRLAQLTSRLKHIEEIKTVLSASGWREVEAMLHSIVKRKKDQQNAINYDDPADKFMAFEKRALYLAGFVQGVEYILNDFKTAVDEEEGIRQQIKDIEKGKELGVKP